MRLILVLVAAVLLPAWIARSGHMLLVSHAVCAAHGELVHGAHEEHEDSSAQPSFASGDHDDGHDHCDALATDPVVSAPPLVLDVAVLSLSASDASAGRIVVSSRRSLLLRAPKTSPPA